MRRDDDLTLEIRGDEPVHAFARQREQHERFHQRVREEAAERALRRAISLVSYTPSSYGG